MGRFLEIAMPHADDPMSMDVGHALIIGRFVRAIGATSVVEVGCCYGISTGAVLDALEERSEGAFELRQLKLLHLIDIKVKRTVMDMTCLSNHTLVTIDECPSLSKYADGKHTILGRFYGEIVILDGDHAEETVVAEVDHVLSWPKPPRAIILHDTGRDGLPGPRAAVDMLRSKNWCVYHNETAGPRSSRGLTICVADEVGGAASSAYRILELGK